MPRPGYQVWSEDGRAGARLVSMTARFLIPGAGGRFIEYEKPKPRHATVEALAELAEIASVEMLSRSRFYLTAAAAHEINGIAEAKRRSARKAKAKR